MTAHYTVLELHHSRLNETPLQNSSLEYVLFCQLSIGMNPYAVP